MSGINQDRVGVRVAVDSIALGIWSNKAEQGLIASEIVPNNPYLELEEGMIFKTNSDRDQINDKPTAPLEPAQQVNASTSSVEYKRLSYRRSHVVEPSKFQKNLSKEVGKLREQQAGVRFVTTNLKKVFESIMANKIFNANNFNNSTMGTLWSNYTTSTPVADLNTEANALFLATSFKPNTCIMGINAYKYYLANTKILNSIKSIEDALIKKNRALELMQTGDLEGIQKLFIAGASINQANIGQAENRGFIWNPNMVWIGYIEQNPMGQDMTTSIALTTEFFTDSMGQKSPVKIRTIIPENAEEGVEVIEGKINVDVPIVEAKLGRLLTVGA